MKFTLYAYLDGTRGQDTEVTLELSVDSISPPRFLADFVGGSGSITFGYTDTRVSFGIGVWKYDPERLELSFEDGRSQVLHPEFKRTFQGDLLRPLVVSPLATDQRLRLQKSDHEHVEYVVFYGSWLPQPFVRTR